MKIKEKIENFHTEMGNLIYYFYKIINSTNYNTENLKIIRLLIIKTLSNATSANILVYEECFNEAQIILRSGLETVVLIAYLTEFPEKIEEYICDSQILKIKNQFITYKMQKDTEEILINSILVTKPMLLKELENLFLKIKPFARSKILNGIGEKEFRINSKTYKKIDKYFTFSFKPFFMRLEDMYKEIDGIGLIFDKRYRLREILFPFYNESSQVAHGSLLDWNGVEDFESIMENLFHYFYKITLFLKLVLKKIINITPAEETKEYFLELKKANINLEKLVYGKVLKH